MAISSEHGARTFEDLLNADGKQYGRVVSSAQKVSGADFLIIQNFDVAVQLAMKYHSEMEQMDFRAEIDE